MNDRERTCFLVQMGIFAARHWPIDPDTVRVDMVPPDTRFFLMPIPSRLTGQDDDLFVKYEAWEEEPIYLQEFRGVSGCHLWMGYGSRTNTLLIAEPEKG